MLDVSIDGDASILHLQWAEHQRLTAHQQWKQCRRLLAQLVLLDAPLLTHLACNELVERCSLRQSIQCKEPLTRAREAVVEEAEEVQLTMDAVEGRGALEVVGRLGDALTARISFEQTEQGRGAAAELHSVEEVRDGPLLATSLSIPSWLSS